MVKRYWRPPPKYYDEDKLRAIREIAERLPALVEARDEHSYVMLIDKWFPDMTPEERTEKIKHFRACVKEVYGDDR
ncbi:MAG: hypothetical protein WCC92_22065 [Candidatus Korobacteraceae bacterium]